MGRTRSTPIKDGVAGVGRVIVAAALIMSSVFFSFLLSPDRVSKEFGLLLGVAILTDALLMRMTLVPALLTLLRDRSWAIPGWLERALPNVTIEAPGERESRGSGSRRASRPDRRPVSYSLIYGRPSAAGGRERPISPTRAISVST